MPSFNPLPANWCNLGYNILDLGQTYRHILGNSGDLTQVACQKGQGFIKFWPV